jgi:hypothetical protein
MGRGAVTRRWIAGAGGVLVNALVLGGLALLERAPPVAEAPAMILELERAERTPGRRSEAAKAGASSAAAQAQASVPSMVSGDSVSVAAPAEPGPPAVEPAWRVDPKAVERWKITEGNPDAGWGRYHRACYGHSNEHMTPEEKERCYDAWGGRREKRSSPTFVGPIDETKWETLEPTPRKPPTADQERRRHRDLCKVYGNLRNPNALRQGACP